jgi:phosphohistidine phosphatase
MELILWRHAQAEDGTPDEARRLTARGERDAARVADWLRERLPPDTTTVLSSPTRRTRQTADALGLPYGVSERIAPGADVESVIAAAGWPDRREGTLVLVGHQPWIGEVTAALVAGRPDPWPMRKAGFWWLGWRERGEVLVKAVITPEMLPGSRE